MTTNEEDLLSIIEFCEGMADVVDTVDIAPEAILDAADVARVLMGKPARFSWADLSSVLAIEDNGGPFGVIDRGWWPDLRQRMSAVVVKAAGQR